MSAASNDAAAPTRLWSAPDVRTEAEACVEPGVDRRQLPSWTAGEVAMPFAIFGMDELVRAETEWEPHAHPTHELAWNTRGVSSVTVDRRTWTITPAIGVWMPAGTMHTGYAPAGTWYRTAHFNVDERAAVSDVPVAVEITPLLTLLLERLTDADLAEPSRALTEALVFDVLRPATEALLVQVPQNPLLQPIVDAWRLNPGDSRTLDDWAVEIGVNARTVTRAFQAETGMSFASWHANFRAQRAAMLLASGTPLEDVAHFVGYGSVSAFGAAFRRVTGLTPGEFRTA